MADARPGSGRRRLQPVYAPGENLAQSGYVLTIGTDVGIVGEYVGGNAASYAQVGMVAEYLLGKNSLQREGIYNDLKRGLRKLDRMGIGPIDVALWDIAGKLYQAPISELLGGYRARLPVYASTYHGDAAIYLWLEDPYRDGGISSFGHRTLRQIIKTPILIGEHLRGHALHVEAIVGGGTDFVRADPDYDCGITGVMKIAHSAEGFGLDVEVHAPGPAQRHCIAAIRNTNYYELGLVHPRIPSTTPPVYACDYSDDLQAIDAEGHLPVPRGPGVGVPIDWDWVRAHETDCVVYE